MTSTQLLEAARILPDAAERATFEGRVRSDAAGGLCLLLAAKGRLLDPSDVAVPIAGLPEHKAIGLLIAKARAPRGRARYA